MNDDESCNEEDPLMSKSSLPRVRTERLKGRKSERPAVGTVHVYALAAWLALLTIAWVWNKTLCYVDFPKDCDRGFNSGGAMDDIEALYVKGVVLAWMVGLLMPSRYEFLFQRKRWWFFLVVIAAGPGWSGLGYIKALNSSLTTSDDSSNAVLITATALICITILGFHLWYAWTRDHAKEDALVYTLSRSGILAFYTIVVLVVALASDGKYEVHFHHYLVAYALALFCQYNHWFSVLALAVTTGIFVQGLAVYDYATLFDQKQSCFRLVHGGEGSSARIGVASEFFAFTTKPSRTEGGEPFYLRSCLVDESGNPITHAPPNLVGINSIESTCSSVGGDYDQRPFVVPW